jgi:glutamate/aspartate transport system permease protein
MTLAVSLLAWCLALLFGLIAGIGRTLPGRIYARIAVAYTELFRNVPLLAQLFIWYFVLPELVPGGSAIKQLNPMLQQFSASVLCLGFFTSARIAEQVRAGLQSLSPNQKSAGLALGLSLPQTYRFVLVPMAIRVIVPPLTSEFLNIIKNSAVCSTLGLLELAAQGRQLVDYTAQPYESFLAITFAYLAINSLVMLGMRWLERRARIPGYLGSQG